jgi:hypothetical protein
MDQFFPVLKVHDYRLRNIYKCDLHTIIVKERKKGRKKERKEKKADNTPSQMSSCTRIPPHSMFNFFFILSKPPYFRDDELVNNSCFIFCNILNANAKSHCTITSYSEVRKNTDGGGGSKNKVLFPVFSM